MKSSAGIEFVPQEVREFIIFQMVGFLKTYHRAANNFFSSLGIPIQFEQMPPLMILYASGKSLTQQEIANILERDKSSIQRSIQSLSKAGYIEVESDATDKRKNMIRISPSGVEICKKVFEKGRIINQGMQANITEEEMLNFFHVLNKMRTNCENML